MITTTLPLDTPLAEDVFDLPCYACDGRHVAAWIVSFRRPDMNGHRHFFLCDPCLVRWKSCGFGVRYERDATWERL